MQEDRRTSVRRDATLPFAWREVEDNATLAEICQALGLPGAIALSSHMAELEDEFKRLCASLSDARVADVLRVLDQRLSVLEQAVLVQAPLPGAQPLAISADGVGFDSDQPVKVGTPLGIHLVLPESYHVVGGARVSHCAGQGQGYRVGAEFRHLEASAARRLTRYAIGRARED